MKEKILAFITDQRGDFVQQALFLVLVVVVAIAVLEALGVRIVDTFQQVLDAM